MIVAKPNPIGVDYVIQQFQSKLHEFLLAKWAINTNQWFCYDRCYKNQTSDGFIPEIYSSKGNYSELLFNDKVFVQSFFGIGDDILYDSEEHQNVANVHLIFMVNIGKLKSTDARPDEEVRKEVQDYCSMGMFGFTLESLQLGITAITSDYSGFKVDANRFRDMQPFHIFRLNFELRYDYKIHNCNN